MSSAEQAAPCDVYCAIAQKCGLSVITVRKAFKRVPVTYITAVRIARAIGVPVQHFRIKEDRRGQKGPA